MKKNKAKVSAADFLGTIQIVFFHPEDLNMLYLGPDLRRNYLNLINLQVSRKYVEALGNYTRTIKQRNALLKAIHDNIHKKSDLALWDEKLAEYGTIIMIERAKLLQFFNERLELTYQKISQGKEEAKLAYRHTLESTKPLAETNTENIRTASMSLLEFSPQKIEANFLANLASHHEDDIRSQHTSIGPHRDDVEFFFNNRTLQTHASRGEYRSLLLALKLIELEFFEEKTGQKPLLLLDDVFSELDFQRQTQLLEAIETHQTILTATHLDEIVANRTHKGLSKAKKIEINAAIPAR